MNTAPAIEADPERMIVSKLVDHALTSGFTISVNDGEEWVLKRSTDREAILAAMFSTDSDTLSIRDPKETWIGGTIVLIYGNGTDVISDFASRDLDGFSAWMKPVTEFAEAVS